MDNLLSGLIGSLIGALVGGWAVLRGVNKQHENDKHLAQLETQKKIKGVLQAIYYEIKILGEVYRSQAGKELAQVGESGSYLQFFSMTQEYFIVYPANCDVIGQILDDTELVKAIINTYNIANFLIESYRVNNQFLIKHNELIDKLRSGKQGVAYPELPIDPIFPK